MTAQMLLFVVRFRQGDGGWVHASVSDPEQANGIEVELAQFQRALFEAPGGRARIDAFLKAIVPLTIAASVDAAPENVRLVEPVPGGEA